MNVYRNMLLLAGLAVSLAALASATTASAAAANNAYCIAQGGPNGEASYVGNCVFATKEQCEAATIGTGNDCVGNIDANRNAMAQVTDRKPVRFR
jgi:ABC-type sugar transport system substrate-binding protein